MIISDKFKDKTYLVLGLGKTGIGAVRSLSKSGAKVFGWDDAPEKVEHGKQESEGLASFVHPKDLNWSEIDAVVLSPGIPTMGEKKHHVVALAEALNKEMITDIDLLYIAHPHAKYICITGTNGKSTTTALIGHILKKHGLNAQIGGNIGTSVLALEPATEDSIYVIEASSFQLEILKYAKFDVTIFLNITPDHLDRHLTFENYFAAKAKVFEHQKPDGISIINIDIPELQIVQASLLNCISFSTTNDNADCSFVGKELHDLHKGFSANLSNLQNLPGEHNKENLLAAYCTCKHYGIQPKQIIEYIQSFEGLEHRMQTILAYDSVKFINDSKASNGVSTTQALKCFKNIHWIVGGLAKSDGLSTIPLELLPNVKTAYLIGSAEEDFAKFMEDAGVDFKKCGNLNNAILNIKENLTSGDNVLLSPACASFDQFKNFEHRGQVFSNLVKEHFQDYANQ